MRKAGGDVCAWRLIIPREKMWSIAQQTKACRRLYNANSKNRGGLRGLRREETRGIVKRGGGRRRGGGWWWWRSRNNADARAATSSLLDTTARRQPLRAPSVPFDFAPYVSSHRVSPRSSTVLRFNLHTTDHVFRLAFISSSSYLATIDQAPIVFASTHPLSPHLATRTGRLHAEDCSLVTIPHVHLLCAHIEFVWPLSSRESR